MFGAVFHIKPPVFSQTDFFVFFDTQTPIVLLRNAYQIALFILNIWLGRCYKSHQYDFKQGVQTYCIRFVALFHV